MPEILVLIIEVIEVQIAHLVEASGKLPPGTLPLLVSSLARRSPLPLACPYVETTT